MHGPGAAVGLDNEPDLNGEVYGPGEDRTVAADLLGEHFPSLGSKVSLDEQRDGPISNTNAGERVGSQVAVEDLGAGSLGDPREDAFSEQRVSSSHERREQVVGRELVNGG
jgi:hypothetical protein